jgi:hypothetical protein
MMKNTELAQRIAAKIRAVHKQRTSGVYLCMASSKGGSCCTDLYEGQGLDESEIKGDWLADAIWSALDEEAVICVRLWRPDPRKS